MSSEESTEIDIKINNIQCTFNVRCLLNIEDIIERGVNVELRTSRDRLKMQLRLVLTFILRSSTNRSITKYYISMYLLWLVPKLIGMDQNLLEINCGKISKVYMARANLNKNEKIVTNTP